ncbi:hypothetical protein [Umezawaea sp. Da 62-37]|uniref:Rv0361 family membrane protein n=1 Tax=Umezawaea sp. Da 62-37 TaxID=3075927 RepID=UPI0028F6DFF6|nr:hypothetical protein [Umezawaea sp. Da 62-37]WNV88668.1 hypothetical protein RM788_10320 [Umezawaea sp. Da 62-37]
MAAIVVVVVTMTGGSAKSTADDFATELNKGKDANVSTLQSLTCKKDQAKVSEIKVNDPGSQGDEFKDVKTTFSVGEVVETGDTATAKLSLKVENVPEKYKDFVKDNSVTMKLAKEDGDWKICDTF